MKKIAIILFSLIFINGCNNKPQESKMVRLIKESIHNEIMDKIFEVEDIRINNGLLQNNYTYVADFSYGLKCKVNTYDAANIMSKGVYSFASGNFIAEFASVFAVSKAYGNFIRGDVIKMNNVAVFLKKDNGWSLDKIERDLWVPNPERFNN